MTALLTHFLDINLLIVIMFPWVTNMASKNPFDKAEFGKSFTSSFIFVFIFMNIMYNQSWDLFFADFRLKYIALSFLAVFICLSSEFILFKAFYGKLTFRKIPTEKTLLLLYLLFIAPVMEEILFRCFLPYLLLEVFNAPWFLVLLLSALSFSLNHVVYHRINLVTKFIWGIALMALVLITHNVLFAIIAHIGNNIIIFMMDGLKNDRNK